MERFLAVLDKRPNNARSKEIRVIAHHNLAMAKKMLNGKK